MQLCLINSNIVGELFVVFLSLFLFFLFLCFLQVCLCKLILFAQLFDFFLSNLFWLGFLLCFIVCFVLYCFCLLALTKTSSKILNGSGKGGNLCPVLVLGV